MGQIGFFIFVKLKKGHRFYCCYVEIFWLDDDLLSDTMLFDIMLFIVEVHCDEVPVRNGVHEHAVSRSMFEVAASEKKQRYGYQIICLFTIITENEKEKKNSTW